jgi:hypothetical protein
MNGIYYIYGLLAYRPVLIKPGTEPEIVKQYNINNR